MKREEVRQGDDRRGEEIREDVRREEVRRGDERESIALFKIKAQNEIKIIIDGVCVSHQHEILQILRPLCAA